MGEAKKDGAAEQRLEQARERLSQIWADWGLAPDPVLGDAQMKALVATAEWLDAGTTKRDRILRAVQYLLCEPERPGTHKRPCWAPFKKTLLKAWSNVATRESDVLFMQALLLAAWPAEGSLNAACSLLDSAWDISRGRAAQASHLLDWRMRATRGTQAVRTARDAEPLKYHPIKGPDISTKITQIQSEIDNLSTRLTQGQSLGHWSAHLVNVLASLRDCVVPLSQVAPEVNSALVKNTQLIQQAIDHVSAQAQAALPEQELLWWGQARYSHTLRKPYRRFANPEDVTFWAPFEAAELADEAEADVEPAASYVVEVLRALDRDVNEKRPLQAWMESLHQTLRAAGDEVPEVRAALKELAAEDALGMPVTWVRLQAAAEKGLDGAGEAVALPLDESIDRGQWAAWIFREALLDLHFAHGGAP